MIDIELLKYPIGKFVVPKKPSEKDLKEAADYLVAFPSFLHDVSKDMSEEQLNTPYRPGGWTVKELIHHLADSHMNMIIRFKLALTEENPTIVPYSEADWARTLDYTLPISIPLSLVQGVHQKLGALLDSMDKSDFDKTYYHPESKRIIPLWEVTQMYAWHSKHHLAHIQHLMIRENPKTR